MNKILSVANSFITLTLFMTIMGSESKNTYMMDLMTKIEIMIAESEKIKKMTENVNAMKNNNATSAQKDEIPLPKFAVLEEKTIQSPVFTPNTRENSPIYYKFKFDQAVNKRDTEKVISLLEDHPALSVYYYPATFLAGIHNNTIENFYVNKYRIEPIINMEAFEDVAFALAMKNSNDEFLAECVNNERLKRKLLQIK